MRVPEESYVDTPRAVALGAGERVQVRTMPLSTPRSARLLVLALLTWAPAAAQDHQYSTADIDVGRRVYGAQCQLCHGPNGDMVAGVNLRLGRFPRAVTDDDLARVIAAGVPGGRMPGFSTLTAAESTGLIALIRAGFDPGGTAVKVGNVDRGRVLFATEKAACTTCHRVPGGNGPRTAPDLSDIGTARSAAALQRSLLEPSRAMLPINRPTTILTSAGTTVRGRRTNEDTFSVQLVDDRERLVTVLKKDIRSMTLAKESPMPSMATRLSPDEVADLVAYLLSLRGVQ
jgi:putative heme-binding domain-containing protein